jgi:hypothetical protein
VKEIHSFSLVDFARRKGTNERLCHAAIFLTIFGLLQPTLFWGNFDKDPHVSLIETQIAQGDAVRKSGLVPDFARVSYIDLEPSQAFEHYCQLQCGLAPILLLHDQRHEYLLLNALHRPDRLPEGYRLMRDFGQGLLLLKKV